MGNNPNFDDCNNFRCSNSYQQILRSINRSPDINCNTSTFHRTRILLHLVIPFKINEEKIQKSLLEISTFNRSLWGKHCVLVILHRTQNDNGRSSRILTQDSSNLRCNISFHFLKRKNRKETTNRNVNHALRITSHATIKTFCRN